VVVRRRWLGVLAGVAATAVLVAVYALSRNESTPAKPLRADTTKQFGDDADLMRRLERHKLVKTSK
jgi:hypothetical protein